MQILNQNQLDRFEQEGYLVVEGLLDEGAVLQPLIDEYSELLDSLATKWQAAGELSSTYSGLPFGQRLTRIIAESGQDYYQHMDFSLPRTGVTEDTPMFHGPALFGLLRHPRLLDAVESFIGPEIYSNPVQHVRIKPPERSLPPGLSINSLIAATPWHQDLGVVLAEADASDILTVWIPITEATVENGCLAVLPGSHRGELLQHCPHNGSVGIPERYVNGEAVPLPMSPGDVLFLTRRTIHMSLPNISDEIRWSLDLRYNPIGQPTGRPSFPGFVARSRAHPDLELRDAHQWGELWRRARSRLARETDPTFNRWDGQTSGCA